jgi:hypothetical protein
MAKVNNDTEKGEGTIWFDYFTVYDPSGHERMPSKKALSKGAIAGAVIGAVIGFTFLFLGAYFWIRKRRLRWKDEARPHLYNAEPDKDLRDYAQEKRGDMESLGKSLFHSLCICDSSHVLVGEIWKLTFRNRFQGHLE